MYRKMFVTLAAIGLVLFAGVENCMQPYWESDANSTVWSAVYKLTRGDSICIQNGTIDFAEKWWNGPLTNLYDTAAWTYETCDNKVHVFEIDDENRCFDKIDGILDKTVASTRAGYVIEQHTLARDWSSSWDLNSLTSNLSWRALSGNIVFIVLAIIGIRLIWRCTERKG